ncbi:MAG: fluoride efflux transporter CrcB [Coxiella sp. (in: Bacteria)]|nr:MAG: fluoride efflux transporter CrcB [Coxiella sp. (in: g-proteobacteria)]
MGAMLFVVASGGALGAVLRFLLWEAFDHYSLNRPFPWGILVCNVLGSFVIGVLAGILFHKSQVDPLWRAFLVIGVCGGFTTFSSFSLDTIQLLRVGDIGLAFANMALSLLLCLAATYVGMKVVYH